MHTNGNRDFFKFHMVNENNKYKKAENVDKVTRLNDLITNISLENRCINLNSISTAQMKITHYQFF